MNVSDNKVLEITESLKTIPNYHRIYEQILAWTNGQKEFTDYLLQLIYLRWNEEDFNININENTVNDLVINEFDIEQLTANSAEELEAVKLIQTIKKELINEEYGAKLLVRYRDLLINNDFFYTNSFLDNRLIKLGLAKLNDGKKIVISSLIFKKIFNLDWVNQQISRKKNQKKLDKYHLILVTSLVSIILLSLLQYFLQYSPYKKLLQCNNNPIYKNAIDANIALDETKIQESIERLKEMRELGQIEENCLEILYDLQYSQAIYLSAGIDNKPLQSVKTLCEIPESYFENRTVQPWFTRWSSLYRKTTFPQELKQYLNTTSCPAQSILLKNETDLESFTEF